jgi:hypothetical protein
MAVTQRIRYEVLRRDGYRCRYCRTSEESATLTVDHVLPTALGGTDDPANLVAACVDCNAGKTSTAPDGPLVDDVAADAVRWARAITQAAEEAALDRSAREKKLTEFTDVWDRWKYPDGQSEPRPTNWAASVESWMKAGLTIPDLKELADIALGNSRITDSWRYFAGCCWKRVKQRQARAKEILAAQDCDRCEGVCEFGDVGECARSAAEDAAWGEGFKAGCPPPSAADTAAYLLEIVVDLAPIMRPASPIVFDHPSSSPIPFEVRAVPEWLAS